MRKEQNNHESRTKQENHILASSACRHLILPLVCEKRHLRCGLLRLHPAGEQLSAGCMESGEIFCSGCPDTHPDQLSLPDRQRGVIRLYHNPGTCSGSGEPGAGRLGICRLLQEQENRMPLVCAADGSDVQPE